MLVLRRALQANPNDATAHFLLGSLFLAGGQMEEALGEWEKARALDPRIPVLHRNVGLTLLYSRRDGAKDALRAFEEGMSADPTNVELYQGADQALSLLGRGADERIAVLQRYPGTLLPSTLVYKLSLALSEASRFGEAEALFPGRFFPREEFGTKRAAGVPRGQAARGRWPSPGPGTRPRRRRSRRLSASPCRGSTSRSGMKPFVTRRASRYYLGELLAQLGRRARRRALATRDGRPRPAAGGVRVSRRTAVGSDEASDAEWRPRLEAALAEADTYLFRGSHYPALATLGRGLPLRARQDGRGRRTLRQVFTLPDKGMPHHMARLALEER
jgi:tetratricopeptide (TPR) repeat protein